MGLIGFGKDVEKSLLEATSPFVFSTVNERSILRFLKLIARDNGKIGTYAKLAERTGGGLLSQSGARGHYRNSIASAVSEAGHRLSCLAVQADNHPIRDLCHLVPQSVSVPDDASGE